MNAEMESCRLMAYMWALGLCWCQLGVPLVPANATPHPLTPPIPAPVPGNHTSRKSSPSLGKTLPCRQRLRNHLSFMNNSRKLCLNCWDSCTIMFFSWLQNFCSSLRWRLRLCSSNSRLRSALCWSSFSYEADRSVSNPSCLSVHHPTAPHSRLPTRAERKIWMVLVGDPCQGFHHKQLILLR